MGVDSSAGSASAAGSGADGGFVDTHVHFWDHEVAGLHWPYLDPAFDHPRLRGMHRLDAPRFTEPELRAQAGTVTIADYVHVQSATEAEPGTETAWLTELAATGCGPGAIVARAPLAGPDLDRALDANAASPLLRGVRDMAAPGTIGTDEFTAGFGRTVERGLSVELLVPYPKYPEVVALARRHPEATIVLGHAGLAERRDAEYFAAWSTGLAAVAACDNVVVKISALASGADPDWTVESIAPWVRRCLDAFGPDRSMFATNWPIDRLYGDYQGLVDAYRSIADDAGLDGGDGAAVFAGTARRVYGLAAATPASRSERRPAPGRDNEYTESVTKGEQRG